MGPGTAMTSRPWSSAVPAVIRAPEPAAASTTSVTRARPLMSRFRRGKLPAWGRSPGGNSLRSRPWQHHPLVELPVGGGIDDTQSVPEHADRRAARIKRRGVGDGVEASRHPAHDHEPCPRGQRRHLPGDRFAVRGVVSAPDHRERRTVEQAQVAEREEDGRRVRDGAEGRREFRVIGHQDSCADPFRRLALSWRPVASGVALMAVAQAWVIPGRAHKNANGAEWAPSGVWQASSRLCRRAGPRPGTWVSARYASR